MTLFPLGMDVASIGYDLENSALQDNKKCLTKLTMQITEDTSAQLIWVGPT